MLRCTRTRSETFLTTILLICCQGFLPAASRASSPVAPARAHSFAIHDGKFLLDGKPFVIISGELHYPRIPRAYWRHRLKMAKAMGLNAITTYVFWNWHEPEKGKFRFTGDADLVQFLKIAQEEGLYVILRPGPYVCAEWEFGGFPYWLLNEKGLVVRSRDEKFLQYTERYFMEIGKRCAPLQADRGGNLLMVQVENEYGSYGSDKIYMGRIRDMLRKAGFTVPLFTADGPSQMPAGHIEGALPALNGDSGPNFLKVIDSVQPGGPYFAPEIYPGWLDHWGEPFIRSSDTNDNHTLEWFVKNDYSINLYMFHGGTNFGFWNGANFGGRFEPHITSYDYDAPLDEAGRPTSEYRLMRETLRRLHPQDNIPEPPPTNPIVAVPRFTLAEHGSLSSVLPHPVASEHTRTMEELNQAVGYVLYRTKLKGPMQDKLRLKDLRDYAVVMVNGKTVGTLDRRRNQQSLDLTLPPGEAILDILVENGGRINYGELLTDNHKGITQGVWLGEEELKGWQLFSLPMNDPSTAALDGKQDTAPTLYKGAFTLAHIGDTWLDLRGWTKGAVWVNGHALGRYWFIGPQQTLYVPGPWLKPGENEVVVFEMVGTKSPTLEGRTEPILDSLVPEPPPPGKAKRPTFPVAPAPTDADLVTQGAFSNPTDAQNVTFVPVKARYVCLQSLSAFDDGEFASCAEFMLFGPDGKPLRRSKWRILYTDSEEDLAEDGYADNMIDGDEATIWHTVWGRPHTGHPHFVVIDLGEEMAFSGFRYVPRRGDKPGKIKGYKFYASQTPFGAQ